MNRHLLILSNAYFVLAALLGLPGLAGTLFFGWGALQGMQSPTPKPAQSSSNPNSLLDIVESSTRMLMGFLGLLGGIAEVIFVMLAIVSACALAFAILLLVTGRGIRAQKTWARWLGLPMMAVMGLLSFGWILGADNGFIRGGAFLLLGVAGYAIWALVRWVEPTTYAQSNA